MAQKSSKQKITLTASVILAIEMTRKILPEIFDGEIHWVYADIVANNPQHDSTNRWGFSKKNRLIAIETMVQNVDNGETTKIRSKCGVSLDCHGFAWEPEWIKVIVDTNICNDLHRLYESFDFKVKLIRENGSYVFEEQQAVKGNPSLD